MLEVISSLVYSNEIITWIFFIFIYFLSGFLLKYIDSAFDDHLFNKKKAFGLAVILACIASIAMIISTTTTIVFFALILSLIIAKKVDNIAFILGAFFCFLLFFILGGTITPILNNVNIFVILFLATLLEEKVDYKKGIFMKKKLGKKIRFLFEYGFMLKLSAIIAFIFLSFQPLFCISLIVFDFAYDAMLCISYKTKRKKSK